MKLKRWKSAQKAEKGFWKWTKDSFAHSTFIIDKCHPYHFETQDLINLFKDEFMLIRQQNIDYLDIERIKSTNKSLTKKTFWRRVASFLARSDRATPYIYSLVSFIYKKQLTGRPAMSNHLFVFKKSTG